MEQVNCNICGNKEFKTVFCSKSFMFPDKTFMLVQCVGCGLVFLNPRPALDEAAQYYKNYHLHLNILKLNRLEKIILLPEAIGYTKYGKNPGGEAKVLEIGFGDGLFLEYMKNRKWDVYGIEIEQECVNRLKNMGIKNVYSGDIFSGHYNDESFDLVRMNQTLEHMHDPLKILLEIKRVLKKNGKLIIAVPNFEGACHKLFKQYAYSLHLPFHLYFFSLATFEKLINSVGGFNIIKVHKNHSFVLYLASMIQFLKRYQRGSPCYSFSEAKIINHRLIGLITSPIMKVLSLFLEGDSMEIEIIKT